jgi:hypothetical protein
MYKGNFAPVGASGEVVRGERRVLEEACCTGFRASASGSAAGTKPRGRLLSAGRSQSHSRAQIPQAFGRALFP